ncbi:MAG: C69 family dipeptidase [Muribaculaceae bacterium]|nr:C69 family dipeptidase [Muribaculaceae bacterium]
MTKRILLTLIAAVATISQAWACTSLIAAKGATADGSVMITYAADSHTLYGELYNQPAADYPEGAMRKVYEWDTGKYLGEIPEVSHTYATIGNMNEHGLAITESTWGGRDELAGSGLIDYGSLIYITLQRAKTAREAIKVMTELVATYGYASSGESFSIADGDEAWIMELIGKGKADKGAVWVARRVPDGHISGHANHARIHQFPLNDPETLYSPDVIEFARQQGYFEGKDKDFSFSLAYALTDFSALRGCDARVWAFFNKHSQDMEKYLAWIDRAEGDPLPLWVKPTAPLTAADMKWMMRDHFEGTPYDMTQDIGAGPFDVPYRWRPMSFEVDGKSYTNERAIATQQTGFSLVAQLRSNMPAPLRGLLWFGTDDANTCVYLPIYCSVNHAPHEVAVGNGDICTLSWDANFWVNNYVANQAYNRYSLMIPDIRRVQSQLEDAILADTEILEASANSLTEEQMCAAAQSLADKWAAKATADYKALGDYLLVKYMDGNQKHEDENGFKRTETGIGQYPMFPGYNERYYRSIVDDAGERLQIVEPKKR